LSADEDLAELFGLDMANTTEAGPTLARSAVARPKRAKAAGKKKAGKKKKTRSATKTVLAAIKSATRRRLSKRSPIIE
jgi:hypothetical protein